MSKSEYVLGAGMERASPFVDFATALGQVDAAHRRLRIKFAREVGMTVADLTALIVTSDVTITTPKVLASELGLTSSAVTTMVDRLCDSGYVSRAPSETDRRSILVSLTPKGTDVISRVWQRYLDAVRISSPASLQNDQRIVVALRQTAAKIDGIQKVDEGQDLLAQWG